MRDFLSVDRDANKIRLLRSTYTGTFLLVEGGSDKIFYERFTDKLTCQVHTVSGKPSSKQRVIAVLKILEQSDFPGVLAIVDADFERLTTFSYSSPNLIRTDTHDLETMLIKSPALDKLIAEFGSEEKINQFRRDIRLALLEAAIVVGYLLFISLSNELNLTFDGITFSKFIDEQTLLIDELKLIKEVKNKSQAFSLKDEDLQQKLLNQKSNNYDPWQVCCGHDLVEILSLSLRKVLGSNKPSDIEPKSLERILRLAYEDVYFRETQIYSDIRVWENKNQPFQILRNTMQ
ncbi:conserved hypothetical protein [Trichormus variabilis ATCC 29413]|uniref:DUF4435 domain-containing protein n=3 Tax=Anabaena variabilis TaxID=264691 RepID=Q3MEL8_TRIV2|nr:MULTISPECIES: DUF4435 domain-containing protein [Nostocaceae]ABA20568.1 conserved hypothetical protein [Trichormus variabilis ATCC 29413]MBC1213991.1 DUF4435 domain-containing protein [Trichormus variabilis ARAD]MBC1269928.1 DUF4435 domain-containing protein [Trichormus variabilis FSR]MBC1300789.1 DUF4435 domain-containing protein [Trichormus variabilis N2B]MBC1312746.1 DUF4435 domain-containing protein [Trichormus variabilis PNB]